MTMPAQPTPSDFDLLRQCMQRFGVRAEEIAPDVVLEALDLDSLALIELRLLLQKRLGVVIETDAITPQLTVGELAAFLASAQVRTS